MANILGDDKKQQILALGRLGWPLRRIEHATGIRRETASAYLQAAGIAIREPRRRRPPANPASGVSTDPANPASEVSTDPVALPPGLMDPSQWPPPTSRSPTASACEPYRDLIGLALGGGRNAMAIWQDLVDDHGFAARYASVRRFVVKLRGQRTPDAHPVIVTAPGEEGQVDYGDGPMVRHPVTRKYRRTRLFVFTLGYSRKSIRLLTFTSSSRRWAELHEEAFRRLGGAVATVVLDNLKEGVLTPDIYDPTPNPLFRDVLTHYGAVALPRRVRHANRKRKVESAVGHTQATPLKGCASRVWRRRRPISIAGTPAGPTRASTAPPSARSRRCLPRSSPTCARCPSNRFATTSTAPGPCISTAASKLPAPTTPAAGLARARGRRPVGRPPRPPARSHDRDTPPRAFGASPAAATRFIPAIGPPARRRRR